MIGALNRGASNGFGAREGPGRRFGGRLVAAAGANAGSKAGGDRRSAAASAAVGIPARVRGRGWAALWLRLHTVVATELAGLRASDRHGDGGG